MNRLIISFFLLLMLFSKAVPAQQTTAILGSCKKVAVLPAERGQERSFGLGGPVAGIHHDVLIVGGGSNFPDSLPWQGGKKKYYSSAYVFKIKNGKLAGQHSTFQLPIAVAYAACCSAPEGVVYAGGENESGISDKVVLLQWDGHTLINKNLPNLPLALTNAGMTLQGTVIYLAGGETATGVSDKLFALDLARPGSGWTELPSLPKPASHAVLLAAFNGNHSCIYLAGGRKKNAGGVSDLYQSLYEYDIDRKKWTEKQPLPYPLTAGTGIATRDRIILFGGDKGTTFHQVETLLAAISREKEETKKQELVRQKNDLQAAHPGFSNEVIMYDIPSNTWQAAGTIPFATPVTTTAVIRGKEVFFPSGEIKAGVRSPNIIRVKLQLP